MGLLTTRVNGLIRNARRAFDDVRQNFNESFGPAIEPTRVPIGLFKNAIAVVTPNEVNDRHGTGVILRRAFEGVPGILSIRSTDLHGEHQFGNFSLRFSPQGLPRAAAFEQLLLSLNGNSFRYVICVPYHPDELVTAIALKEAFEAKLCIYVMDDNHIATGQIPEKLLREALEKADLRLAISAEMREAYETKFRKKFWLRPPVVTAEAISLNAQLPFDAAIEGRRGIVVGSLWSNQMLEKLASAVSGAQLQVDWFGNCDASWLNYGINELAAKGVRARGFLSEPHLVQELKQYAYALVPSGTLDENDLRADIARYSLPTRMPFLLAVGNIPTIVLGSPKAAAASFVERFHFGVVVGYQGNELRAAVERICSPSVQREMRDAAARNALAFSSRGVGRWILESLDRSEPASWEMEDLMPGKSNSCAIYVEPPVPSDVFVDFAPLYRSLRRLRRKGFSPDFIVDVGASTGIWSATVNKLFPRARFILVEPLLGIYKQRYHYLEEAFPDFEIVQSAISNENGFAKFQVSADLYGSSLVDVHDDRVYDTVMIPTTTLDRLQHDKAISGRGILKLDIQLAEHLALEGGRRLLQQIDAVVVELSLVRLAEQAKTFDEMIDIIKGFGFRYYDDVGEWRSPVDGTLVQKDVVFIRGDLFPFCSV